MKKFKFRLESVLYARIKALEDRQLEMSEVQYRLNRETDHLENLYNTSNKTTSDLEALLIKGAIDILTINGHRNYIEKLKFDIKNQHKIIASIEIELEEKKKAVLEALKAKTMLEKLKEKAFKEYITAFEKHDLKEIDEIATSRQHRAKR